MCFSQVYVSEIREILNVDENPSLFAHFAQTLLSLHGKARRLIWILFAAQRWVQLGDHMHC
jgi:hypothetical protein